MFLHFLLFKKWGNSKDNGIEKESEIEIRIACVGANYINFICTHFEFFSCRYTKNTYALFAEKNCRYSNKYNNYNFEYVIKKCMTQLWCVAID